MWSPEAMAFLRELEANNDREWFKANRKRYDTELVRPAQQLGDELQHLGTARILRPYRDTRFRPGPPIREQLGLTIAAPAGSYYVELSLDGLLVGAGLHHAFPDQIERFRAAIDDEARAEAFEGVLARASAAGLEAIEPALKRAPKGYRGDHPRLARLRMKHLTVFRRHPVGPELHTSECDATVVCELDATRPLIDWLSREVGPSTRPRPR